MTDGLRASWVSHRVLGSRTGLMSGSQEYVAAGSPPANRGRVKSAYLPQPASRNGAARKARLLIARGRGPSILRRVPAGIREANRHSGNARDASDWLGRAAAIPILRANNFQRS